MAPGGGHQPPALVWLIQYVLRLAEGNVIAAGLTGVLLFIGLPIIWWYQNRWKEVSL